jgi:hypothetical protein
MSGYIYVLKSLCLYKIGKAKDFQKRLITYKTHNPHGIEVIIAVRVRHYDRIERNIHKRYKDKRFIGEWFNLSENDVLEIKSFLNERNNSIVDKINNTLK